MKTGDKVKGFVLSAIHFVVHLAALALICWALHTNLQTYGLVIGTYVIAYYQGVTHWVTKHGWKTFQAGANGANSGRQQYQQPPRRDEQRVQS